MLEINIKSDYYKGNYYFFGGVKKAYGKIIQFFSRPGGSSAFCS